MDRQRAQAGLYFTGHQADLRVYKTRRRLGDHPDSETFQYGRWEVDLERVRARIVCLDADPQDVRRGYATQNETVFEGVPVDEDLLDAEMLRELRYALSGLRDVMRTAGEQAEVEVAVGLCDEDGGAA